MPEVIVIGAGLSGLSAAYELEKAQVPYTLIEVKRHLGGSIQSQKQGDFLMDLGAFALTDTLDKAWLAQIGLEDALYSLDTGLVAFKDGTQVLVDALASRLSAPCLMRMAVSSIGELEQGRFGVCLENGILLDAKALILALPARYLERLFYGYINAMTEALMSYHYDTIQRVSLGFQAEGMPERLRSIPDMAYVFQHATNYPTRVPAGHVLCQFGLRIAPHRISTFADIVRLICHTYHLPEPVTGLMSYWAEADPMSCYHDEHQAWLEQLRALLPERIALIGSDFCEHPPILNGVTRLDERIQSAQVAVQTLLKQF